MTMHSKSLLVSAAGSEGGHSAPYPSESGDFVGRGGGCTGMSKFYEQTERHVHVVKKSNGGRNSAWFSLKKYSGSV
jgi:hypothetical protein